MRRPEPEDDVDRSLMAKIDVHGWAVLIIGSDPDEGLPGFHYSAGIYQRTGKPELILIGLGFEVGHWVVNEYARRCVVGETFEPGKTYEGFLEAHLVTFVPVDWRVASSEYTTWTAWYYRSEGFPLLQLVWPDSQTRSFPWQTGFREELKAAQPVLGQPFVGHS